MKLVSIILTSFIVIGCTSHLQEQLDIQNRMVEQNQSDIAQLKQENANLKAQNQKVQEFLDGTTVEQAQKYLQATKNSSQQAESLRSDTQTTYQDTVNLNQRAHQVFTKMKNAFAQMLSEAETNHANLLASHGAKFSTIYNNSVTLNTQIQGLLHEIRTTDIYNAFKLAEGELSTQLDESRDLVKKAEGIATELSNEFYRVQGEMNNTLSITKQDLDAAVSASVSASNSAYKVDQFNDRLFKIGNRLGRLSGSVSGLRISVEKLEKSLDRLRNRVPKGIGKQLDRVTNNLSSMKSEIQGLNRDISDLKRRIDYTSKNKTSVNETTDKDDDTKKQKRNRQRNRGD